MRSTDTKFHAIILFWIMMLFFVSGCLLPIEGVPYRTGDRNIAFPKILKNDSTIDSNKGKLWDRSQFLIFFPFHLMAAGNIIEQGEQEIQYEKNDTTAPVENKHIVQFLKSQNAEARAIGIEIAKDFSDNSIDSKIWSSLNDPSPYVRIVGLKAIARKKPNLTRRACLAVLKDKDEYVRMEALRILGKIGAQNILPQIYPLAKDRSSLVRGECAKLLGIIANSSSIDCLKEMTADREEYVRVNAKEVLKKLQSPRSKKEDGRD